MLIFPISARASVIGFPFSCISVCARYSLFSSTSPRKAFSISALSCIGTASHFFCPTSAAAMAFSTSWLFALGTQSITLPVAGSMISKVSLLMLSAGMPLMIIFIVTTSVSHFISIKDVFFTVSKRIIQIIPTVNHDRSAIMTCCSAMRDSNACI